MIYSLGIDISNDEFSACLMSYHLQSQSYQVISRKTFTNKPSGFKACMSWLARHTRKAPGPVRMSMEATGVYYEPFALFVADHHQQIHLAVVLPSQSKKYIESRGLRSKTDKIDAYGLALLGAERKLAAWKGIDPFWRKLRVYTRTRAELQDQRTRLGNQLHALDRSGMETPKADQALRECIQTIDNQIDELTKRIEKLLHSRNDLSAQIAYLRSIPGIGTLTIACILAETNGFAEFHRISQLISFSGYDVKIRTSGKWTGQPKLSKQGSKYIRRAMFMPASTIIRSKQGAVYELYQRLLGKHNIKMKAHVAVQKKLLTYMYTLWNHQKPFDSKKICHDRTIHQTLQKQKKVAPPQGEATVDTSLILTQ